MRNQGWCAIDDCPATICNGPHVKHFCPNGDLVVSRAGDPSPCPFCGWTETTVSPTSVAEQPADTTDGSFVAEGDAL